MRVAIRILCILLAAALLAACVLGIVEIALAALERPHLLIDGTVWDRRLRTTTWSTDANQALAAVVVLGGLVALVLAWWPRRDPVIGVGARLDGVDHRAGVGAGQVRAPVAATVRRRDLETALARAARRVDSVTDATVHVDRGGVTVRATTARRAAGDVPQRVEAAVTDAVQRMAVATGPVRARVRTSGGPS